MEILSLNVCKFRGYKGKFNRYCIDKIVCYLQSFLEKDEENIAILQEVPYGIGKNTLFSSFKEKLGNKYNIILPIFIKGNTITMAVTKSNNWDNKKEQYSMFERDDKEKHPTNKIIELCYPLTQEKELQLIGVHMPLNEEAEFLWEKTLRKANNLYKEGIPAIVIGDFNAHRNIYRESIYRDKLNKFTGYIDLIDDDTVTFLPERTTIDHVFCSEHLNAEVIRVETKNYTDHVAIIAKINL